MSARVRVRAAQDIFLSARLGAMAGEFAPLRRRIWRARPARYWSSTVLSEHAEEPPAHARSSREAVSEPAADGVVAA